MKKKKIQKTFSKPAQALYNRLVAEKVSDPNFRIEVVEYHYTSKFAVKADFRSIFPVGEVSKDLEDIMALVNEDDFNLVVKQFNEAYKPRNESEEFTEKFNQMLSKYNIDIKSPELKDRLTSSLKQTGKTASECVTSLSSLIESVNL